MSYLRILAAVPVILERLQILSYTLITSQPLVDAKYTTK